MKNLMQSSIVSSVVVFGVAIIAADCSKAQSSMSIESSLVESSVQIAANDEAVSYQLLDDWGGLQAVDFDLSQESWMAVTADGDVLAGSIPAEAMDEYYTQAIPVPCFTSPWAAAGCGAAAAVGALVCEIRASINIRRLSRACSSAGYSFGVTSVSGCGNVQGYCFQPNHHTQMP